MLYKNQIKYSRLQSNNVSYKMGEQPGTLAASSYAPTWLSTPVKNTRLRGATEG